jgi:hypothetical protein
MKQKRDREIKGTRKGYKHYKVPEQRYANSRVRTRLYCDVRGCYTYIKGWLGYNGSFVSDVGNHCDLRNQMFVCSKHAGKNR